MGSPAPDLRSGDTRDFPNETRASDLGCGKLSFTESPPQLAEADSSDDGKAAVAGETAHDAMRRYVHTVWTSLWTTTGVVEISSSYRK